MRSPYTPGVGGYLLGIVVATFALPWEVALIALATGSDGLIDVGELVGTCLVLAAWAAIPASVIGPLGALLVHHFCRDEPRQGKHVWVAFVSGVVLPGAIAFPFAVTNGPRAVLATVVLAIPVGIAAAIGRAAVIPLVRAR